VISSDITAALKLVPSVFVRSTKLRAARARPDVCGALWLLKFHGGARQTLSVVFDRDDFDLIRFDQVDEPEGPF
jgi:hypothetical protein